VIAESKKTGNQVEFTLEQWRNFERTGHAKNWKVIDAGIVEKVEKIEVIPFSRTLDVEYHLNYRKKLEDAGIKFDKRIKDEYKLKEIYELNK